MAKADFMQTLAEKWEENGNTPQAMSLGASEDLDDRDMLGSW